MIYWYYRLGKKQAGPVSFETLAELTRAGTIRPDTMLWHSGIPDWLKASEVADLSEPLSEGAAVPEEKERDPTLAGPWSRFWARIIDIYVFSYGLGLALGYVAALYAPALYLRMTALNASVFGFLLMPFVFVIFAVMMSLTGTTPGKAIIGIKIENVSGRKPLVFHFLRELKVWSLGFGFGIPLLSFVVAAFRGRQIAKSGSTGYDRGFSVVRRKSSNLRYGLGVVIAVGAVSATAYSNVSDRWATARALEVSTWTNPATGKQAKFLSGWTSEEWKAETGKLYYFNSARLLAEALLGYEPLDEPGVDPVIYGEALQEALAPDLAIDQQWTPITVEGFPAARVSATHKTVADTHVEITVVVMGQSAWRVLFFARGRPLEELAARGTIVRSLLSTAKDINVPVNLPCEGENCLSGLQVEVLAEPS